MSQDKRELLVENDQLEQLSEELRLARMRSRLTVRQVAERSGLTPATVSRLELGQIGSPKPAHLQRLAVALGVDVEDFYAAAGFLTGSLPELEPYLRAKFGLGADAAHRVEGYLRSLQDNAKGGTSERINQQDH